MGGVKNENLGTPCRAQRISTAGVTKRKLLPGQTLPTFRMLSEQFHLSFSVVNQAILKLAEEGSVYSVPRLGTFVGQRQSSTSECYLLLLPDHPQDESKHAGLQAGFDNLLRARRYPLTSFHLPRDEVGRTAAGRLAEDQYQ